MNLISISTAPSNQLVGKPFYDLYATLEVMRELWAEGVFDGFEFQNVAEWDAEHPPRDEGERRLAYWTDSQKYTTDQIAALLGATGLPIHSVHANRDVGVCLCSGQPEEVDEGRRLIHESLSLAEQVGAFVCVFHLWNTQKEDFDTTFVHDIFTEITAGYPRVKASVENIPTRLQGTTPFDLAREYDWITLDLRWAALCDELGKFTAMKTHIANVHLRGEIENGRWIIPSDWFPAQRSFDFYQALDTIKSQWGYQGLLTVENIPSDSAWQDIIAAVTSLREI
jgi:sugar phosphate isomerase/epimerase